MINPIQLKEEIVTALEWLECPYKAPEQIDWARGFLNRMVQEFGCRGADLLAYPDLLAEKVKEYNQKHPVTWYAAVIQKISSNESAAGNEAVSANFCNYPQVGKRFEFLHSSSRMTTTSPVKSITKSSDGRNLIVETTNSTYDVHINKTS
jgi:hypothetical protein